MAVPTRLAREQRRRARLAAELRDEGVELLEDDDSRVLVEGWERRLVIEASFEVTAAG